MSNVQHHYGLDFCGLCDKEQILNYNTKKTKSKTNYFDVKKDEKIGMFVISSTGCWFFFGGRKHFHNTSEGPPSMKNQKYHIFSFISKSRRWSWKMWEHFTNNFDCVLLDVNVTLWHLFLFISIKCFRMSKTWY